MSKTALFAMPGPSRLCGQPSSRPRVLSGILALILFAQCVPALADEPVAAITYTRGNVTIKRTGQEHPAAAHEKDRMAVGDVVLAGADSSAQITFPDEAFVTLAPNSSLRVNQYTYDPGQQRRTVVVKVLSGQARFLAYKPLSEDSSLRVETGQALILTNIIADFVVSVSRRETEVAVLDKGVSVRNASPVVVGELGLGVNQRAVVKEKSPPAQPSIITPEQRKAYLKVFRRL